MDCMDWEICLSKDITLSFDVKARFASILYLVNVQLLLIIMSIKRNPKETIILLI